MVALLLKQFMSCHGTNAVPQLLIDMVYVGGLEFSKQIIGFAYVDGEYSSNCSCPFCSYIIFDIILI
jgi:hypothetical protein